MVIIQRDSDVVRQGGVSIFTAEDDGGLVKLVVTDTFFESLQGSALVSNNLERYNRALGLLEVGADGGVVMRDAEGARMIHIG